MKKSTQSAMQSLLNVEFGTEDKLWLQNGKTLRKIIGILGMSLPVLLVFFLFVDNGQNGPLSSISHYYYTRVSGIFVAILSILAIFLIVYRGKEPVDFILSTAAGIFALCVVSFPTDNITDICLDPDKTYSVTILPESNFRTGFHYASAGIFLGCLASMSLFLFTKSNKSPKQRGDRKIIRNRIYRICGVLMIVAMAVIFAGFLGFIPEDAYNQFNLTFWMETLAVESFGFAWLVKGETILADRESRS